MEQQILRIAQIVCQSLQFISCELVLIPQDMIINQPIPSSDEFKREGGWKKINLNASMATEVEIKFSRTQIRHAKLKRMGGHQELTRQYVSTSINGALIIVVISKQPSVMTLLDHHKSNWRLQYLIELSLTDTVPEIEKCQESYLIMPPVTVLLCGSCHTLKRSCISSWRWAWALTSPAYLAVRMSQVPMGMVKPPGLDTGHMGLGAARELFWMDLEGHFVHLPYARHSMAVTFHLWGGHHHVPGIHRHVPGIHRHVPGIHRHVPGIHASDTQMAHHPGDVALALAPDNVHHDPGVAHHHGHPVEAPSRVLHHAVEFVQAAVWNLDQKLLKTLQKFLQSH
ncbi:hypothetical protein U9M48_033485 [Paspalum notatum var. saurae]|uniref:Uncharacterized protein n=1 Tax=Paspalum notatum var. saurae TaxID=547442 RepID=A0AAQ3U8D5_PASNO